MNANRGKKFRATYKLTRLQRSHWISFQNEAHTMQKWLPISCSKISGFALNSWLMSLVVDSSNPKVPLTRTHNRCIISVIFSFSFKVDPFSQTETDSRLVDSQKENIVIGHWNPPSRGYKYFFRNISRFIVPKLFGLCLFWEFGISESHIQIIEPKEESQYWTHSLIKR